MLSGSLVTSPPVGRVSASIPRSVSLSTRASWSSVELSQNRPLFLPILNFPGLEEQASMATADSLQAAKDVIRSNTNDVFSTNSLLPGQDLTRMQIILTCDVC